MQQLVTAIITVLILAGLGKAAHTLVLQGHYWVLLALPVGALYLGWIVGNEADRDGYRSAGRWLIRKLTRQ